MSTGNGHCSALQGSTSSPDEQHTPVTLSSQSIAAAHKTGRGNTQVLTYCCQGVVVTENLQREGIQYESSDSHKENSELQNGFHKVHRTSEGFALRSDLLNGFVPDSLNGNSMEDMCKTTTCTLDPKSEEVTTPPHISSRKEQILEDLQNFSGNPKSIVVSGKIAYTQSEPNLSTMLTAHQQQETDPIGLLSRLDLFEPQVLKNKKDSEDLTNFSNGQSVHATKSIPVMSSSVAVSTALPKGQEEELLFGEKLTSRSKKAESAHGDGVLTRTKSMPSNSSPDASQRGGLPRSTTEKRRVKTIIDNANVRLEAEAKALHRKKQKLVRRLGTIQRDGAVEFDVGQSARLAKDLFGSDGMDERDALEVPAAVEEDDEEELEPQHIPPLRIVMLIVGTRGDVQPFIAIGKKLQEHGHQVRLASHANFRDFVRKEGLEFYPLGGDPKILAEYMVKNKGFLPSGPSEIATQRKQIKSIVHSLLPACIEPDMDSGLPFHPHAIIANPPAYGHVHVAQYLNVPLHIFFTMPWTPTGSFPHPLSRVKQQAGYRLSYQVVDSLIWIGISGIINAYRKKELKLRPITYLSGSQGSINQLPTGYIWSPHLVPKPKDWGPLVDVVGFCFLNLASGYKPPEDMVKWLAAGKPPIYVGFGSLPVEDPEGMTKIIVEALRKTGQRGIIGKGWGGIGNLPVTPDFVYLVSDCPHDWLFPQCAAVIHHGGAGTTAAGLKAACPTTIIPFFGDQPFWGDRVHEKGVGPPPIPVSHFSLDKLVNAIEFMLDPEVKRKAVELARNMEMEDGIEGAVNVFHKHIAKHLPDITRVKTPTSRPRGLFSYLYNKIQKKRS
ncbi:unnamed protein product [Sphagnum jensenii]|uniref:Glycosyltransferase family 28 N-terminal domain-containing protein n=1 Tax=Sphagnum jensenii TaxID=128206 RepID=A0ABP0WA21_9BRYO